VKRSRDERGEGGGKRWCLQFLKGGLQALITKKSQWAAASNEQERLKYNVLGGYSLLTSFDGACGTEATLLTDGVLAEGRFV